MAAITRTKYQPISVAGINNSIFANLDSLKYLYRNEDDFRANTYKDVDENSLIPSILFWADRDLHYTVRKNIADGYVELFKEFDPKVPLRDGNFKRTEHGYALPEMLTREDDKQPGDALTTHKQYYLSYWQDENAKIDDIHLRACVDWHLLDFAKHFNDFSDYNRITMQTFAAMNEGLQMVDKLCVDTFIISLFGGYLHNYPIGSPLYRFFGDANNTDLLPDEGFSKDAHKFFKPDGQVAKKIKEIATHTKAIYKSRFFYLTNTVESEIIGSGLDKKIPALTAMPVKMSTKAECIKAIRGWYMRKDNANKFNKVGFEMRRNSLYSFISVLVGTVRELCTLDARNWCGYDFYTENKDKRGLSLQARRDDLVIFMNDEDLEDLRYGLKGSPAMGTITETFNGQIERLERSGVTIFGLNYILPGHAVIFDKHLCFKLKEFYHSDNTEYFAYHLVESRIKHVFKRPIIYSKTVFRAIHPGADQLFTVSPYWASKNLPLLVEK